MGRLFSMISSPRNTSCNPYFCRRKETHIVTAYDLKEGHHYPNGDLLFDCYDKDNNPVVKMKNGNTHTAFVDSFFIDDGKGRYFIKSEIFYKTYSLIRKEPVGGIYYSNRVKKQVYDLLEGHLDEEGNLLFDYYNDEEKPVISTLESKAYTGKLDDFLMIGIEGEPYFFTRDKFLLLYEFVSD